MRRFIPLLLPAGFACSSPPGHVTIPKPRLLSTAAVDLGTFSEPSLALAQAKNQECQGLEAFFKDYTQQFLSDVASTVSCQRVQDAIYSPAELAELRYGEVYCESAWTCFKARWEIQKNGEKDVYYALLVRFDDQSTRGLIAGAYRNRSVLAHNYEQEVYASQLLDPGLAPLLNTFDAWVGSE